MTYQLFFKSLVDNLVKEAIFRQTGFVESLGQWKYVLSRSCFVHRCQVEATHDWPLNLFQYKFIVNHMQVP